MAHYSTKTYGHEQGLSAVFRQPKAKSHCSLLHGYALSFSFQFACHELDENGWVMDFGALKPLKSWLQDRFDHKLLVAEADPYKDELCQLAGLRIADVIVLPAVGCEAFAQQAFEAAADLVWDATDQRVWVVSVECREHGANSAIYTGNV